jgi:alkylhydroperoxidase family enzyme
MARIPYLDPERAPESVRRLLAPDRPQKIALLFGHAESNWPRLADLLLSILGEQELEPRLRELGILRVANLRQARYEWDQHVVISASAGVRPEQIESIARGRIDSACFGPRERLVLDAATELVRDGNVSDATLERLRRELPPRQVVELLLAVGVYEAVAKLMNALGLDPEGAVTSAFAEAVNRGAVAPRGATPQGG